MENFQPISIFPYPIFKGKIYGVTNVFCNAKIQKLTKRFWGRVVKHPGKWVTLFPILLMRTGKLQISNRKRNINKNINS